MPSIGNLWLSLRARTGSFSKDMKGAQKIILGFTKALAPYIGAGVAISALKRTAGTIDELAKNARRIGIATDELQALQHAATLGGVEVNQLKVGLVNMTRRISEAATGTGEAVDALRDLGLEVSDLQRQTPDEMFRRIADAIQTVSNDSDKARIAYELFGRSGVDLITVLEGGRKGLDDAEKGFRKLGRAISPLEAKRIEEMNDQMSRLKQTLQSLVDDVLIGAAPLLERIAAGFGLLAKAAGKASDVMEDIIAVGILHAKGFSAREIALSGETERLKEILFGKETLGRPPPTAPTPAVQLAPIEVSAPRLREVLDLSMAINEEMQSFSRSLVDTATFGVADTIFDVLIRKASDLEDALKALGEEFIRLFITIAVRGAALAGLSLIPGIGPFLKFAGLPTTFIPAQHGFHGVVRSPTLFMAGEAGAERVDIGQGGSGGIVIQNLNGPLVSGIDGPSILRVLTSREGVLGHSAARRILRQTGGA